METKNTFLKKMDAQMAEFNLKLDTLMAKSGHADVDAKPGYNDRVKALHEERQNIEKKMAEIKEHGNEDWEKLKTSVESSVADLDQSLREAMAYFT